MYFCFVGKLNLVASTRGANLRSAGHAKAGANTGNPAVVSGTHEMTVEGICCWDEIYLLIEENGAKVGKDKRCFMLEW
jgi:hypothetical protein